MIPRRRTHARFIALCGSALLWATASPAAGPRGEHDPADVGPRMTLAQAAVLGIVEGLTEYIPVSSTGHLLVLQRWMGLDGEEDRAAADSYAIAIQAGAILAVLGLYRRRIRRIGDGLLRGRDAEGRHLGYCLAAAFLPAAVLALLGQSWIKQHLFGLWPIVGAWLAGGVLLLFLSRRWAVGGPAGGSGLDHIAYRQAWIIGLAQCAALWPGVSRSLATISGGVLAGLSLPAAVEFSFLLGLVTLGAATVYEMLFAGQGMLEAYGLLRPLLGLGLAFVFAALSMAWMLRYVQRHSLAVFGWYRIGLALVTAAAALSGRL